MNPREGSPEVRDVCVLCGATDQVRMGLYHRNGRWDAGRRCVDHKACTARQVKP